MDTYRSHHQGASSCPRTRSTPHRPSLSRTMPKMRRELCMEVNSRARNTGWKTRTQPKRADESEAAELNTGRYGVHVAPDTEDAALASISTRVCAWAKRSTHSVDITRMLATETNSAKGTKRALDIVQYTRSVRRGHRDVLRSEDASTLSKCAAMARHTRLQRMTRI